MEQTSAVRGVSARESLTLDFVRTIYDWPAEHPELLERCRELLVDGIACAVAGSLERGPSLAAELVREAGASPTATVIGKGFSGDPVRVARVNGMSMHVLDFEPMWKPANHVLSTILPPILAVAERLEAVDGKPQGLRALSAIAKGVETQGRLRVASGQYDLDALKFHPPGVVGPLAAAMAASHMLRSDVEHTAAALGVACSRACGILINVGSMTKALHCGDAAAHGLESALLASKGFTANGDALSGVQGFASAYFGETFDPNVLVGPIEKPRALDPGPAWKLFPTQYATHYAVTAALDCRQKLDDLGRIEKIYATVPVMPYVNRPLPSSGLEGKFSFQYAIAAALLDGEVGVPTYSDKRRFSGDMEDMLAKIELKMDETIPRRVDAMYVHLVVVLDDGSELDQTCVAPIGSWSRPVERDRLDAKARSLFDPAYGKDAADRIFELIYSGQEFSVRELMSQVAGEVPPLV